MTGRYSICEIDFSVTITERPFYVKLIYFAWFSERVLIKKTWSHLHVQYDLNALDSLSLHDFSFKLRVIIYQTMLKWIITVRHCYRPVYYHNWRHGLNVAHTMFLLLDRLGKDDTVGIL